MIKTSLRKGFTLAEVLTTLMVIGVVAAMTIPTLINSTDDQQHKTALKKAISILSQAAQLNIAKEVECAISDSKTLCDCFKNSMQGSCTTPTEGINYSVLTTPDGIAYAFFYRGDTGKEGSDAISFKQVCGTAPLTSQKDWQGATAPCVAIVDTNGLSKGTRTILGGAFNKGEDENAADDNKIRTSFNTGTATKPKGGDGDDAALIEGTPLGTVAKKDQFPIIITASGIYPAITNYKDPNGHLGYDYMYGSGSNIKTPFPKTDGGTDYDSFTYKTAE